VLLFFAIFFVACTEKQVKDKYCSNERSLLSIPDSIKQITIDYSLQIKPLFNSIEKKLGKNLCWNLTSFGLILTNKDVVQVEILRKCKSAIISCFIRHPEVHIILNQKGMVMIENEITSIDSVKFWIGKNFPNDAKYGLEEISIRWDTETPKDSIEKAFVNITDGYLQSYQKMAQKLFSKNLCDLKIVQLDSLKEQLPIKIRLELNR